MSKSKNPNVYSAEAAVLDAALATIKGGTASVTYTLGSPAEATVWRARAYQLRTLLRKLNEQVTPPGMAPVSKYDHVFLQLQENRVIISLRRPGGTLTTQDGTVIPLGPGRDVQRDPLQDEAEDFLRGLE